jgi:hypothetical protein
MTGLGSIPRQSAAVRMAAFTALRPWSTPSQPAELDPKRTFRCDATAGYGGRPAVAGLHLQFAADASSDHCGVMCVALTVQAVA